jgi:hypothetical protein
VDEVGGDQTAIHSEALEISEALLKVCAGLWLMRRDCNRNGDSSGYQHGTHRA